MEFEQIDVLKLLPQRPPFVMIDKLLHCDYHKTRTSFIVREDNIFCDNDCMSEAGIIENIAQTCAARMGYINSFLNNKSVMIGFIGAIRNQAFFRLPKTNEKLVTEINTIQEVFQTTLVSASVHVNDELISSCEMKISITDMPANETKN